MQKMCDIKLIILFKFVQIEYTYHIGEIQKTCALNGVPAEGIDTLLIQSDYTLRTFFSPDWHMIGRLTPGSAFAGRSSRFVMTHNILRMFETWQQCK